MSYTTKIFVLRVRRVVFIRVGGDRIPPGHSGIDAPAKRATFSCPTCPMNLGNSEWQSNYDGNYMIAAGLTLPKCRLGFAETRHIAPPRE